MSPAKFPWKHHVLFFFESSLTDPVQRYIVANKNCLLLFLLYLLLLLQVSDVLIRGFNVMVQCVIAVKRLLEVILKLRCFRLIWLLQLRALALEFLSNIFWESTRNLRHIRYISVLFWICVVQISTYSTDDFNISVADKIYLLPAMDMDNYLAKWHLCWNVQKIMSKNVCIR